MSVSWSDVTTIAAELSSLPVATQAAILTAVDLQIDDDIWTTLADEGRKYLAAHLGTVYSQNASASGPVLSETLGPMSRTYAASVGTNDDLATTKYGRWYLHLLHMLPSALGFVP